MTPRALIPAFAVALCAGAAAGGGGGGGSPSVASLGGATTTTSSGGDAPSGGSLSNSSGGGSQLQMRMTNGAKFSACMRKNGVPNFPDPSSNGNISIGPGSGVNTDSPKFRAAQQKCQSELPHRTPSAEQQAKMQAAALAFSKCMRDHGVHDFPDPQFGNGTVRMAIKGGRGSDLNPSNPTFKRAQQACQSKLPFKGAPGAGPATSQK